jgi:glycolate oxidase iron-sulfur subunit
LKVQSIPLNTHPGFGNVDAPREDDLYRCVHCGLCLNDCPTYRETGMETESPRGRIALMKAVHEGRLGISSRVVSHWESCLQCRACETVCPSGVPFGRLMERTRTQIEQQGKQSTVLKLVQMLFLRLLLTHPWRLRIGALFLRFYQRLGGQSLVRRSNMLKSLPFGLADLENQIPTLSTKFFSPRKQIHRAIGAARLKVGVLSGCVMPLVQGDTMEAMVRVLNHNGCDVSVPLGQGCCGALNVHSGDLSTGRKMARQNIDLFLDHRVDKIVVASAGCGSIMKEYGELLKEDAQYSAKASMFAHLTVDITEFLVGLPFIRPLGKVKMRATYQDPCHLAHAQRITSAPRIILESISGLELVEMEDSSQCCGAAGIYSVTQRKLSQRLLTSKMARVTATGADVVITANPGCSMQLEAGLKNIHRPGRVAHVVDVLDRAYQAEE